MSIFALKEITAVSGKQKFYKLIKDGICEFDEFETEARQNYNAEMERIYALMDLIAKLITLTETQFKDVTPKRELIKEYEFKTRHLRVYAIHEAGTGKIVVCGGYKNTQQNNIRHFREVKKQFLKSRSKK